MDSCTPRDVGVDCEIWLNKEINVFSIMAMHESDLHTFCKEFNIIITLIRHICNILMPKNECNICMLICKSLRVRRYIDHSLDIFGHVVRLPNTDEDAQVNNYMYKQYHVCGKEKGIEKSAVFW